MDRQRETEAESVTTALGDAAFASWSAARKRALVLRVLSGEDCGVAAQEARVPTEVVEAWVRALLERSTLAHVGDRLLGRIRAVGDRCETSNSGPPRDAIDKRGNQ
jgi:hypothetical protein